MTVITVFRGRSAAFAQVAIRASGPNAVTTANLVHFAAQSGRNRRTSPFSEGARRRLPRSRSAPRVRMRLHPQIPSTSPPKVDEIDGLHRFRRPALALPNASGPPRPTLGGPPELPRPTLGDPPALSRQSQRLPDLDSGIDHKSPSEAISSMRLRWVTPSRSSGSGSRVSRYWGKLSRILENGRYSRSSTAGSATVIDTCR